MILALQEDNFFLQPPAFLMTLSITQLPIVQTYFLYLANNMIFCTDRDKH
jgi:hypothetical protein